MAILLGPYRNLSTLTAAALALHPNIQVLNHAAERLWRNADIDFFARPKESVYRDFLTVALGESESGRRGDYGGSILLSHAFDDPLLKEVYARRYGDVAAKASPTCLVWKDSMVIQRRLAAEADLLPAIVANLPEVRFILPIRQPIDCALSNMRTGHAKHLLGNAPHILGDVLDAVLHAIAWVLVQRDRWPDRFVVFTQQTSGEALALELSRRLGLPEDTQWLEDFRAVFRPRANTTPAPDLLSMEREKIGRILAPWPEVRDALLG